MMARPRDTQNTRDFDWVEDKKESDRMTEKMSEWDLALIKHKIREDPRTEVKAAEKQVKELVEGALASYDPMERKTVDELDELEDDEDDEVLELYRAKRIAEMKAAKAAAKFGVVYHIREDEYRLEVSETAIEASDVWVVVHLFKDAMTSCTLLNNALDKVAKQFPVSASARCCTFPQCFTRSQFRVSNRLNFTRPCLRPPNSSKYSQRMLMMPTRIVVFPLY
jgi:hypothetical protein